MLCLGRILVGVDWLLRTRSPDATQGRDSQDERLIRYFCLCDHISAGADSTLARMHRGAGTFVWVSVWARWLGRSGCGVGIGEGWAEKIA